MTKREDVLLDALIVAYDERDASLAEVDRLRDLCAD